tara:strand:+ start:481 stop:753 length:273 start_codon:yes stop_codon:yes gene_type:complete
MNTQKKYIINCTALFNDDKINSATFKKTEKELRDWAEEIRQNEGLQEVTPNYTEVYNSLDGLRRKGYIEDIDECIEFLEGYDWEIIEQNK